MTKPLLADHLRETLQSTHGSVAGACQALGLNYENLKKSLQRNRFSPDLLRILFPGEELDQLRARYEFHWGRGGQKLAEKASTVRLLQLDYFLEILTPETVSLIQENRLVAETTATLVNAKCAEFRTLLEGNLQR